MSAAAPGAYQVLARKYRPSTFEDLIGQDAMVRTLSNAFELNRIHQAYLLTGVRGVGKTTTARILARAFNYELPAKDGQPAIDTPTIDMRELGVHCQAIIESRHVDVIEMDAASHTGVDDIREIIESVRYRPVMARCKVYIIDEVHMLSKNAFNALLKTLEEPPEHVRFIFATTESEKIPVTVRSRCQRFDLRRIESGLIIKHLAGICARENVGISDEALALVARAAEGSVRDSLSLLDQAIAHGSVEHGSEGKSVRASIRADNILAMLGAGNRARMVDLFDALMKGDAAAALDIFKQEYDRGADALLVMTDLAEFVHFVTRLKVAPGAQADGAITEEEKTRGADFAKNISIQTLTLAWQIISKGIADVKDSPRPFAAAEMVLVRLAYASGLPSPEDVLRRLSSLGNEAATGSDPASSRGSGNAGAQALAAQNGALAMQASAQPRAVANPSPAHTASAPRAHLSVAAPVADSAPVAGTQPRVQLRQFEDLVALAHMRRDIQLKLALERDVRLVHFEQGKMEFALAEGSSTRVAADLGRRLEEWTGERWQILLVPEGGAPSLKEQADAREREKITGVRSDPLVQRVLEQFPGAQIVEVRSPDLAPEVFSPADSDVGEDIAFDDQLPGEEADDD